MKHLLSDLVSYRTIAIRELSVCSVQGVENPTAKGTILWSNYHAEGLEDP